MTSIQRILSSLCVYKCFFPAGPIWANFQFQSLYNFRISSLNININMEKDTGRARWPVPLHPLSIYESKRSLYIFGRDNSLGGESVYRLMEASSSDVVVGAGSAEAKDTSVLQDSLKLNLDEHSARYTRDEISVYLKKRHDEEGDMKCLHDKAFALFGFVKLVDAFHLVCVTNAPSVAQIHGHSILGIEGTSGKYA